MMQENSWAPSEDDYQVCRLNGSRRRVTFEEKKTYYDASSSEHFESLPVEEIQHKNYENLDENDNLAETLGNTRNKQLNQEFREPSISAKTLLLEMIQELAIPVDSNPQSQEQIFVRSQENGTYSSSSFFSRIPEVSNQSFSIAPTREIPSRKSNFNANIRKPKVPIPPPPNNHQLFIVNMANRQTRRWGELNLMVDHEPPWKAINIKKEEADLKHDLRERCARNTSFPTGPSQSGFSVSPTNRTMARLTREIGARNENPIGQLYASNAFPHSKCENSSCIVQTPHPNGRAFVAAAEDKWNNNDEEEETDDDGEVGRFVITTERKHLNRLKKLLTNPQLLRETKNEETRKLLGNDLRMAEIVELCTKTGRKNNLVCDSAESKECTSSCEVIRGSQTDNITVKDASVSDLPGLEKYHTHTSYYDLEEMTEPKKSKKFSLTQKMSSWGKLKLVKDYIPPWKKIRYPMQNRSSDRHKMSMPEDQRVNKISSREDYTLMYIDQKEEEEMNLRNRNSLPSKKPSVPKMMVVPSTRRVDHPRGHITVDIASFVNTKKYGKVPEFFRQDCVTGKATVKDIAKTEIKKTGTKTITGFAEVQKEAVETVEKPIASRVEYITVKEEARRINEVLRAAVGTGFLFQRNTATPNPDFWNAPKTCSASRKRAASGRQQSSRHTTKTSVVSRKQYNADLKTIRQMDIALAEQIMEQNRQLGFKPGRLSVKELSYRTGLPLGFVRMWEQQRMPLSYYDARCSFLKRWIPPWKEAMYKSVHRMPSKLFQQSRVTLFDKYQSTLEKEEYLNGNYSGNRQNRMRSSFDTFQRQNNDDVTDLEDLRIYTPSACVSSSASEVFQHHSRSRSSTWKGTTSSVRNDDEDLDVYLNRMDNHQGSRRKRVKLLEEGVDSRVNKAFSKRKVARQSRLRERIRKEKIAEEMPEKPVEEDLVKPKTSEEVFKTIKKKIRGMLDQVMDQPVCKEESPLHELDYGNQNFRRRKHHRPHTIAVENMTDDEFDMALHGKIKEIRRRSRSLATAEKEAEEDPIFVASPVESSAQHQHSKENDSDDDWTTDDSDENNDDDDEDRVTSETSSPDNSTAESQSASNKTKVNSNTKISSIASDEQQNLSHIPQLVFPDKLGSVNSHRLYKIQEYLSKVATKKVLPSVLRGRVMSAPPDFNLNFTDSLTDLKDADGRHHDNSEKLAVRGCRSFLF